MTHTESLSARIARLETAASNVSLLRERRSQYLDALATTEEELTAAEHAQAVLSRLPGLVSWAEDDAKASLKELAMPTSPAGDTETQAELPESSPTGMILFRTSPTPAIRDNRVEPPAPAQQDAPAIDEPPPTPAVEEPIPAPAPDPAGTEAATSTVDPPDSAELPIGTIREQLLDLIGANPGMMVSDAVSCLPHLNPATVAATLSKMCLRGQLKGEGSPKRISLPQAEAEEPAPAPEPVEPAGAELSPTPDPEAPDLAVVELPPTPDVEEPAPAPESAPEPAPEPPVPTPAAAPASSKAVIRDHPPQPRPAEPREVKLPRDLPPVPQAAVKATTTEVELVRAALKNHGRPMSKSLILNRVIKSGIKSGALEDALAQLVTADQVEFTGVQYVFRKASA